MSQHELLWPLAPEKTALTERDVHIWGVSLEQAQSSIDGFFYTLSADERARAQRFYFARDQRHFIVARGVLRDILSRYLELEPRALTFAYGSKGKPSLAQELVSTCSKASGLCFNLSHSGGLALYAFTYGRALGIDIEQLRDMEDAERVATRFFAAGEVQVFSSLPAHLKRDGFFNCWTRKESYIKATGDGLSMPLDRFEVSLVPGEPARFLRVEGGPAAASCWALRELHPAPGYAAAVCVEGEGWELQCWHWCPGAQTRCKQ